MGRAAARREAGSRTGRGKPALLTHGQALHAPGMGFVRGMSHLRAEKKC